MGGFTMDVKEYIEERMQPDRWYPVNSPAKIIEIMDRLDENIEIIFSKDYKRVKKILWENGKPNIKKFMIQKKY